MASASIDARRIEPEPWVKTSLLRDWELIALVGDTDVRDSPQSQARITVGFGRHRQGRVNTR
jgi:hypothetical protein